MAKAKLYNVMLTRTVRLPDSDGELQTAGPKERGGKPVKVSVPRGVANGIVSANRGYWADGKPREAATAKAAETAARRPARGSGGDKGDE